jgi:hypothetical protein
MAENPIYKTAKDVPTKGNTVQLENVQFNRKWAFWESYFAKNKKLEYKDSMKCIYEWDTLIGFWQFWNNYPGANAVNLFFDGNKMKYYFKDKYRINGMNIFVEGISPIWEDTQNQGGSLLQLEYKIDKEIDKFFRIANVFWRKLMLNTMGENIPHSEHVSIICFIIYIYNHIDKWN